VSLGWDSDDIEESLGTEREWEWKRICPMRELLWFVQPTVADHV
jgi:hypothetical protein